MDRKTLEFSRDAMWKAMMDVVAIGHPDFPQKDQEQLIAGFLHLAMQAVDGDYSGRDDYLGTVIPGLKRGGLPLGVVLAGMVQVAMGGVEPLDGEARAWWIRFVSDYSTRLGVAWNAA